MKMKKSIFKDGSVCYGVDYSKRKDCFEVKEISQEQYKIETKKEIIEQKIEKTEDEKVKEIWEMIVKKQALELLGEDTKEVDTKITELVTW